MEPAILLLGAAGAILMLKERDRRMKWLLAYAVAPVVLVAVFVGFSQGGSRFGIVALPAVILLAEERLKASTNNKSSTRLSLTGLQVD